jgi:hypothetical protein
MNAAPSIPPATSASLASAVALLEQGERIDRLSCLLTAVALAALVAMGLAGMQEPAAAVLLALSVVIGLLELYFAVRVGFDARLFRRLADPGAGFDLGDLDDALTASGLPPANKAARPLKQRSAGACRLLYRQAGSLALQVVLLLLGAVAMMLV